MQPGVGGFDRKGREAGAARLLVTAAISLENDRCLLALCWTRMKWP